MIPQLRPLNTSRFTLEEKPKKKEFNTEVKLSTYQEHHSLKIFIRVPNPKTALAAAANILVYNVEELNQRDKAILAR